MREIQRAAVRKAARNAALPPAALIGGAAAGAALMYALDPALGRRRRAIGRDKALHAVRRAAVGLDAAARDLANQARGLMAEGRALLRGREVAPDRVVEERVRACLGRHCTHPHAVRVTAEKGRVRLTGPILAHEVDDLLAAVRAVRGVTAVENELEVHEKADVSALQGSGRRPGEIQERRWSPGTRLLGGAAGMGLVASGAARGGLLGAVLGVGGGALLTRAIANLEPRELIGAVPTRGIQVRKTIRIDAPVEGVFDIFADFENFPLFMSRVRDVEELADCTYRWTVAGPLGSRFSWVGQVTRFDENELIEWESLPGSEVGNWGRVRFQEAPGGGTLVEVDLRYEPPLGVVGHAIARLLGVDPKADLDRDLLRLKSLVETGKLPRGGEAEGIAKEERQGAAPETSPQGEGHGL
jgi:uncharacterized membrane protein